MAKPLRPTAPFYQPDVNTEGSMGLQGLGHVWRVEERTACTSLNDCSSLTLLDWINQQERRESILLSRLEPPQATRDTVSSSLVWLATTEAGGCCSSLSSQGVALITLGRNLWRFCWRGAHPAACCRQSTLTLNSCTSKTATFSVGFLRRVHCLQFHHILLLNIRFS